MSSFLFRDTPSMPMVATILATFYIDHQLLTEGL